MPTLSLRRYLVQDLSAAEYGSAPVIVGLTRCRQISSKLHAPICRSRQGLADRSCCVSLLQQSLVPRHERPVAPSSWRESGFDSRIQGLGSESRITRCGCFRFARSQHLAACAFPELLMDTTQCSCARWCVNYYQPDLTPRLRQRRQSLIHADNCRIRRRRVGSDLTDPCRLAARSQANV